MPISDEGDDKISPRSLQTHIRPSDYYTQIWNSSENMALYHFCICRSLHHSHFCIRYIFHESCSIACRAGNTCCCKFRCTVRADTGYAVNMSISWLMIWYCCTVFRADLTTYLSYRAFIMGWRWDLVFRSVWPSTTHCFHICMTMVKFKPERRKVSGNDNPHSRQMTLQYCHIPISIYFYYSRHNTILWTNGDLTKLFSNKKFTTQHFFYPMLQISFLSRVLSKWAEIRMICIF